MTRKQIALVILVNALVSTLISLAVVAVAVFLLRDRIQTTARISPTVSAKATPGLAMTLAPTPVIHVVQSGDTITGLALKYDVPADNIIAANGLQNPNYLRVGTELLIPLDGVPMATATFTPAPTATDTPIPFEPPSAQMTGTAAAEAGATATPLPTPLPLTGELKIEITEVVGVGVVGEEQVRITNTGERSVEMSGWTLSDADGNSYAFSGLTLWHGGSVVLHTGIGKDIPPSDFYWGKLQSIWSSSELATLRDTVGQVIDTYVVGR